MNKSLRIVFMGTPSFATGILNAMVDNGCEVVGVITAADKPAGRGQKMMVSDVKAYALTQNLPILQPTNLKDETFLNELSALEADLFVVVAFRMLPAVVWQMPSKGTFNLHASLLPQYRGAAPINWAIINGETETGVSTFFIDDKIDTGEIIMRRSLPILPDENVGSLHDRLMLLGQEVVLETINQIETNQVKTIIQPEDAHLKTAYKLNADNCRIDWAKSPENIVNLIRGLNPYPGAWTVFKSDKEEFRVKIFEATFLAAKHADALLKIKLENNQLFVCIAGGIIVLHDLQFPNKKRMKTKELINGWRTGNEFFIE